MRAVSAGVMFVCGLFVVIFIAGIISGRMNYGFADVRTLIIFVVLGAGAFYMFRSSSRSERSRMSEADRIAALRESGMLESTAFSANRAFLLEEYEDEGPHYFIELVDGRLLYMSGQYLYDYEPDDYGKQAKPRRFPCERFTVWRHRTEDYVTEIECEGSVIEPQPVFDAEHCNLEMLKNFPGDGEILPNITFDTMVANLAVPPTKRKRT